MFQPLKDFSQTNMNILSQRHVIANLWNTKSEKSYIQYSENKQAEKAS